MSPCMAETAGNRLSGEEKGAPWRPGQAEREGSAGRDRPVVLVVDDEESMRDSCTQVLEREGFEVIAVCDARRALDVMGRRRPDVLIVDLKMPGMSGEEFLRRATEQDPDIISVAITGYANLSSAVEAMKAGAYEFLPKPFEAEELRLITGRAVQRRRLALAVAAAEHEKRRMHENFVAMVAHQLKSPAASVKECLDVALSSFGERVPQECVSLIARAARKTELLLRLMDDWLTLARVESGGVRVEDEPVVLGDVVRRAAEAARDAPGHNSVELRLEGCELPVCVSGDAEALREMVFNLVDNALRYTPDGGRVLVRLAVEGASVVVSVLDDGPGIPVEERGLVFEPFFRGDRAKQKDGTGLGLAIASRIAEAHGGRILLKDAPDGGALFEVHLPVRE